MDAYIYQGNVFCTSCAEQLMDYIKRTTPDRVPANSEDQYSFYSDDWPKNVGEPDSDHYCCGGVACPRDWANSEQWLRNVINAMREG